MLNLERKIWVIIGTRPELIKQLPVYYQCVKKFGKKNVVLVNSGQHKNFLNFYSKENQVKFDLENSYTFSVQNVKKIIYGSFEEHMKWWKARSEQIIAEVKNKEGFMSD